MASINSGRVVTAGLLSGLVMNICDMAWNFTVMKDDMTAMAQKFGVDPNAAMSFSGALPFILIDFLTGLLVVWTYAAIRPRFGPGPKTALLAAFVPFAAVELVLYAFTSALGMMPMSAFLRGSATAVVTMALGGLVGGWAYSE
jgi:hypothetical protein